MNLLSRKVILASLLALCLAVGGTPLSAGASTNPQQYSDVPETHYASKDISKLMKNGIVDGYSDGSFHPDDFVTRGTAAVWLSKALKLEKPKSLAGFTDVPASSPYADSVYALKERNIVQGSGGLFEPDTPLTREQMAGLLNRAFPLRDNGIQAWFKDEDTISKDFRNDVIKLKQNFITDQSEFMPKQQVTRAQLVLFLSRMLSRGESANEGTISLDDFLKLPEKAGYRVSPDRKTIAFLQPWENHMNIFVQKIGENQATRITSSKTEDIRTFYWVTNHTVVYPQDQGGDENVHLYAVNTDGKNERDLTPYPGVRAEIIDVLPAKAEEDFKLLVGMNKRNARVSEVYIIDVLSGKTELHTENPGNVIYWVTDNWGRVRAAVTREGTATNILYRAEEDEPFQKVGSVDYPDAMFPFMFTFDNKQLYMLSDVGRDKLALVKYDPIAKKESEVVYVNAAADVKDVIISYKKQAIVGIVHETDKSQIQFLDNDFEQLYKKIREKLSGKGFSISGSIDAEKLLVRTGSDKSYGSYYFYDRKTDALEKIADVQPSLDESKLSDVKPVSYQSRDGLTIHGYLTLPKVEDPRRLPVVVMPHGGPWARDSWGYNMEVQLLANRGYAVLQMNFRGSTGYGKAFLRAGDKEWGNKMQNDITDGVQWLIQQGIADPDRIAIYGASYGGYATLAGVTFTPDLYAAGIDYVGPSSLFTLLNTMPPYWETDRDIFYQRVGDPIKDKKMMEDASPLYHLDQIKVPLMVVQGANDPRVKQIQSDQLVEALRKRNVDVPYMLKQNEGHGFRKLENERDFYDALLYFLNRHVKEKETKPKQ